MLLIPCAEWKKARQIRSEKTGLISSAFTKLQESQEANISVLLRIDDIPNSDAIDMMDSIPCDQVLREADVDEVW